ncbi:hypothetical protein DPMN_073366 [Dreissena polymorpha]|uniref:Uncharacterized protein n=1 Tax=Dreissena polymorpha TaxID=45954 RepID=A0A9D4BYX8_DREPO|nr:hypothetical protein DPMN_073366 [Dreissena polymorpha]
MGCLCSVPPVSTSVIVLEGDSVIASLEIVPMAVKEAGSELDVNIVNNILLQTKSYIRKY